MKSAHYNVSDREGNKRHYLVVYDETAPILRWKTNHRIVAAHQENQSRDLAESYFGDPDEYDDYDLAMKDEGATHWMPLPDPPKE